MENLPRLKPVVIAVVGFTVILVRVALLLLPGPGLIVISLGLAILATEFVWARALLKKAKNAVVGSSALDRQVKRNSLRQRSEVS